MTDSASLGLKKDGAPVNPRQSGGGSNCCERCRAGPQGGSKNRSFCKNPTWGKGRRGRGCGERRVWAVVGLN